MKSHAHNKSIGLSFDSKDSLLSATQVTALGKNGFSQLLPAGSDATAYAGWQAAAPKGMAVLPAPGNATRTDFAALLRTLSLQGTLPGAVLGTPTEAGETPALTGLLVSYFDTPIAVTAPGTSPSLAIGYPADGSSVTRTQGRLGGLTRTAAESGARGAAGPQAAACNEVPLKVAKTS